MLHLILPGGFIGNPSIYIYNFLLFMLEDLESPSNKFFFVLFFNLIPEFFFSCRRRRRREREKIFVVVGSLRFFRDVFNSIDSLSILFEEYLFLFLPAFLSDARDIL